MSVDVIGLHFKVADLYCEQFVENPNASNANFVYFEKKLDFYMFYFEV